jgi:hypothetical protein
MRGRKTERENQRFEKFETFWEFCDSGCLAMNALTVISPHSELSQKVRILLKILSLISISVLKPRNMPSD